MDNILDLFPMTSTEIEQFLDEHSEYITGWKRVQEVEDMNIPMMANSFYSAVRKEFIPTLRGFAIRYIDDHKDLWDSLNGEQQEGLLGRLIRTYPSLLRDLHMGVLLKENGFNVTYNEILDTQYGIDLLVEKDDKKLGLKLSVNTRNSNTYSRIKNTRHYKAVDFPAVKLKIDLNGGKKVNGYYLYSQMHVDKISKLFEELAA